MKDNKRFLGLLLVMGLLISSCNNAKMQPEKEELAIRREIGQLEQERDHEINKFVEPMDQAIKEAKPEERGNLELLKEIYQAKLKLNKPNYLINFMLSFYIDSKGASLEYEGLKKAVNKAKAVNKSDADIKLPYVGKDNTKTHMTLLQAKEVLDLIHTIQEKIMPLANKIKEKKQELDKIVKPKK